ncbi:MAG: GAF domain-containing protein [Chloroflexota bacterium]
MDSQAFLLDESSEPDQTERTPFGRALVIAALALAVGVSLLAPGLAINWARQPFLGVLLEQTLVVAHPPTEGWSGQIAGLEHPDRILSIDGLPLTNSIELAAELRRHQIGDVVTLEVEGPDGAAGWRVRRVPIVLMSFPLLDLVTRFLVAYAVGLIYLALGIWVFIVKSHRTSGRTFAFFCAFLALLTASYFDAISTHWLARVLTAAIPFTAAAAIHLGLVFPQERTLIGRWRVLHYLPYVLALGLTMWGEAVLYDPIDPRAYFVAWRWGFYYAGLAIVTFSGLLLWTRLRPETPEIRQQARIISLGSMAAFAPFLIWVIISAVLRLDFEFDAAILLPSLVLFPLSIAYAIVRHRLLDVNLVVSRGLVYLMLTALTVGSYFLLVNLLGQALRVTQLVSHPVILAFFVLALVLFLEPLRRRTQIAVDHIFYKDRPNYRQELEDFSRALTATLDLPRLLDMCLERVCTLMHATRGLIYLFDPTTNEYTLRHTWAVNNPDLLAAVRFRDRDATVRWLRESTRALYLTSSEGELLPADLSVEERARLTVLQAILCVPLFVQERLIGWLALGDKQSGDLFTPDDLAFLTALADQTAIALENARLYERSTARAHELAILNEVAQTITSTLDLAGVLNLIMSKVVELLDVEAGSLLMLDEDGKNLVFRVALGPVREKIEELHLPVGIGIAGSAVKEGRPLVVNNALSDPRWYSAFDRDTRFVTRSVLAVPLQVKGKIIGVIEALNKQDGRPFNQDELLLLTSFASQAAIAIENARLFTQTDQELAERVAELSTLQEIDRQLNETLDFGRVMSLGLDWALRTTRAVAGNIAAVRPEGDGLQLVTMQGYPPSMAVYQEKPWPLKRGIMGQVARTGRPALVTNVLQNPDYLETASDIQSQLSVPISREGQVIGVITLEGQHSETFKQTDLAFIERLADHMAIAMANARLYADVKAADEAKSEFVSMVSHELKIPMTSIKGYAKLLHMGSSGEVNDKQRSFLEIISSNVDRMDALVQDLLDISRIETGRLKLDIQTVHLTTVVDEVVRLLQHEFEKRQQTLAIQMPVELPPVRADRARLAQVLTNLLGNAFKYTPNGGSITVQARTEDGQVLCSVVDTGIGISSQDQKRLFEKFYRADHQVVREVGGTGLGLSIAKSIIELQGGRIWLESELGKGSVFHFTVPVMSTGR